MNTIIRQNRGRRPAIAHPQRERAHVRPLVLRAAGELFREKPSEMISIEQIAARAGVTRHTLGNHFASLNEIFRISRETMLHELSQRIVDEISTELETFEGVRLFLQICFSIFSDQRNQELRFSILHEQKAHIWLDDEYRRHITTKLIKLCETFLLYKSIPEMTTSRGPRYVAEQLTMFAESLAERYLSVCNRKNVPNIAFDQHLNVAAKAYASIFMPLNHSVNAG